MVTFPARRTRPSRAARTGRSALPGTVALFACALLLAAAGSATAETVPIDSWLVLGPAATPLPAFHDAERHGATAADLLDDAGLVGQVPWPAAGDTVSLPDGGTDAWRAVGADGGSLDLDGPLTGQGERPDRADEATPRRAWMVVRLDVARFVEPKLSVRSPHPLRVWLDGEQVAEKGSDAKPAADEGEDDDPSDGDGEPGAAEASLTLAPGPHLLMVQTVFDPALGGSRWTVDAELAAGEGGAESEDNGTGDGEDATASTGATLAEAVATSTGATRSLALGDLLDVPSVADSTVSADGALVALTLARPAVPSEDRERWVEVRRAEDGAPVRSFRGAGGGPTAFQWAPRGHRYLFASGDETTTLWLGDLDGGTSAPLISGLERFGGATWSPDGTFIVYSASEEEAEDHSGFKRLRSLEDRWPGRRDRGALYQVRVPERIDPAAEVPAHPVVRRLTVGDTTATLVDIAPGGDRLLLTRSEVTAERPFSVDHLVELELGGDSLEPRKVADVLWFGGAAYSPDGKTLLVSGGPSTFGGVGAATPDGQVPNDFDGQAYLYDLASGEARSLTTGYDPAIADAAWSPDGSAIYFLTVDGPFRRIVRYRLADGSFTPLPTAVDSVGSMELSRDGSRIVYAGSSDDAPDRVLSVALAAADRGRSGDRDSGATAGHSVTVYFPGAERFGHVRIGRVEDFSFSASSGSEIVGRVHYPPGFDAESAAAASVPAIVYYYGGTVPVDRSFGGRYPFNLWAAQGYVVYVLQPSGAIGFGQEFSARHVNDWGMVAARDIMEGTRAFLDAHPFVDPARVGCGGASYGGFMTMSLITQTDMFRTAIAHAGISSLASYWGEGWWGYSYSGVASADSYPWNRQDLYVDQSPLFHADRIHTPLLLLHGTADTNVPIGESQQLFTALKILGREVELVTIAGENHHILDYPKRKRWMETILAWYDRELKDQPEWWDHLYPAEDGP